MSTAFRRSRGGGVTATFHVVEVELLRSLVGQLLELVHDQQPDSTRTAIDDPLAAELGLGDEPDRPTDPVLLRLFPDGYSGDDEAAAEFRRFTERGLRDQKSAQAARVLASLATVEGASHRRGRGGADADAGVEVGAGGGGKVRLRLDRDEAAAWLRTLTDLRLALGTRLGVEEGDEERWASLPEDDPSGYVHDVYDWLGFVQETLVRAISRS